MIALISSLPAALISKYYPVETAGIDVVLKEIFKGKVTDRSGEREYFMSER